MEYGPIWLAAHLWPEQWLKEAIEHSFPRKVLWCQLEEKIGDRAGEFFDPAQLDFGKQIWLNRSQVMLPSQYPQISSFVWGYASNAAKYAFRLLQRRCSYTSHDGTRYTIVEIPNEPAKILGLQGRRNGRKLLSTPLDVLAIREEAAKMLDYLQEALNHAQYKLLQEVSSGRLSLRKAGRAFGLSLHKVRMIVERADVLLQRRFDLPAPRSVIEILFTSFDSDE